MNKSTNLSGTLAVLGLIALAAGLVIMLLLTEMQLGAWGLLAVGTALLAVAFVIDYRRVSQAITARRGRFGLGTSLMASIFIGITLLVNAISIGQYHRFDTSSLSQFTLTPQTVDVLEALDTPVKATAFFIPDDYYGIASYLTGLLTEYEVHSHQLSVKYIDPDEHPDQAKQYGITEYQTVVFESGDRRRLVSPSNFITVDAEGKITGLETEHAFTSAILEVTGVSQKKAYFLTGHGEASINANFTKAKDGLLNDLYLVDTLNLITSPAIPDDCAVLIIAAPQNALSESELAVINNYLYSGGQALILTNPGAPISVAQIAALWGVLVSDGTIIDPASCVAPYQNMPLVPADRDFFLLPNVYFPGATAIVPLLEIEGINLYPLVYTEATAWLDKNFSADTDPVFDSDTETMESLAIGLMVATDNTTTRIIIIGDSDFASDEHFDNANNGDLFLNSVGWLAEETSLISIRRNVQPFRRLVITPAQTNFIEYSCIGLLPLFVLAAGGVIWWRRR
jgi:ABC-type uncharacterized transport system involved in gliding motility auxiliary subunit